MCSTHFSLLFSSKLHQWWRDSRYISGTYKNLRFLRQIRINEPKWIESCFANRYQRTKKKRQSLIYHSCNTLWCSPWKKTGPLIFLILIIDILKAKIEPQFLIYADNNKRHISGNNVSEVFEKANNALTAVKKWLDCNKLS